MINFSKHKAVWCKWRLQKKNDLSPFLAGIIPLLIPWEILHISWSGCLKIRSITPLVNNMKLPGIIFKGKRVVTTLIDLFSCIWTNVRASSARNCIDLANAKSGFLHCRMKWYSYSSVLWFTPVFTEDAFDICTAVSQFSLVSPAVFISRCFLCTTLCPCSFLLCFFFFSPLLLCLQLISSTSVMFWDQKSTP